MIVWVVHIVPRFVYYVFSTPVEGRPDEEPTYKTIPCRIRPQITGVCFAHAVQAALSFTEKPWLNRVHYFGRGSRKPLPAFT